MHVWRRPLVGALVALACAWAGDAAAEPDGWLDPRPYIASGAGPSAQRELRVARTSAPPKIDGRLERAVWESAGWAAFFTQREPNEGAPATQQTVALALYDDHHLYFGFFCLDGEPRGIVAEEMRRDARLGGGDYIELVLDTFRDGRSAFYFATNPLAARQDGRIADEGDSFTLDWNCVWDCAAHQDTSGWTAELAIPFTSLRFPSEGEQVWGLNFGRRVRRLGEDTYWAPISREYGFFRLSLAGTLVGLRDIAPRRRVQVAPYLGSRRVQNDSTGHPATQGDLGLDASVGLSSTLTADLTFNPDFAQVEADLEQINLTRFELWFPEKRPFFLEGTEVFAQTSPVSLFYTRRIGVMDGELVPIAVGSKVGGKPGREGLGALHVRTRAAAGQPATDYGVLRIKRDVLRRSSVGLLATTKEPEVGASNRVAGLDLALKLSDQAWVNALGAGAWTGGIVGRATFLGGGWGDDRFGWSASHLDIDEHFDAQLGFIERTAIRRTHGQALWTPWIRRWGLRQATSSVEVEHIADPSHRTLERNVHFGNGVRLEREGWTWLTVTRTTDVLGAVWSTNAGDVPPGTYRFTTWWLWVNTDEARRVFAVLHWKVGGYYGGTRRSIGLQLNARPTPGILLDLYVDRPRIRLPGYAPHVAALLRGRVTYSLSPDFFVRALAQRNSADDAVSLNGLVAYTPPWGHTFHLAYSETREGGVLADRALTAKLAYVWRR